MRLALWLAGLGATVVACLAMGDGVLAAPPLAEPGAWGAWATARSPAEAAFALVRLGVLACAAYLLATTLLAAGARAAGLARLAAAVDLMTVPVVRRAVHGAVGTSLAVLPMASVVPVGAGPALVHQSAEPVEPDDEQPSPPPVMRRLDDVEPAAPAPPLPAVPAEPALETWTIRPGDHLWGVASAVLGEAWVRSPTDGEVAPYWMAIIEENRADLADPENPDLVFAGQVVRLPPLPTPSVPGP